MISIDIPHDEVEKYSKFGSKDLGLVKPDAIFPESDKKEIQVKDYSQKIRERFGREIHNNKNLDDFCVQSATDIWEACNLLKIPLPIRTRLRNKNRSTTSSIGDATDDYEIRVSLEEVTDWLDSYTVFDKLKSKMFYYHECYHLWQQVHFPNLYVKGSSNKIETSALMFEFKMLKNFHPSTPKEFLSKILLLVETFAQLQHERKLKK